MKWKKCKEFVKSIASNLITTIIINALVGFGAPCALIWSSVKSFISKEEVNTVPTIYWIVYIVGLVVSVLCIVSTIIRIVKKTNRPNFPKIQSDVRYDLAISELFFKSREEISCSREVRFEVVCEKIDSIKKQFTWTGTDYKQTVLEKAQGNYNLVDYQRKQPPHGYEVKFDSTKLRGSNIWFKTRTDVEDVNHVMKPFFSHTIKSPTELLELRVTAPIGLLKDVTFTIYADSLAEIPISKPKTVLPKSIGNLETFSYKIEKPNLLYNYRLDWKF